MTTYQRSMMNVISTDNFLTKMARTRRGHRPVDDDSNVDRSTRRNTTQKRIKKIRCNLKSKAQSERGHRQHIRKQKKTHAYNLRSSNSVILVSEVPCGGTEENRDKYAKLGLDSALFLSSSPRAKRKQSHISVITISSSDEDISKDRTAEWVMDLDTDAPLCHEEYIGDSDLCSTDIVTNQVQGIQEAEDIRHQISMLHIPSSPDPEFEPISVSIPEPVPSEMNVSREKTEANIESRPPDSPMSFLTNPINNLNVSNPAKTNKSPHTLLLSEYALNQTQDFSTIKTSQKFYFGTFQNPSDPMRTFGNDSQQTSPGSNLLSTVVNDVGLSGTDQSLNRLTGPNSNDESEVQKMETVRRRNLQQIPSTSQSPVFNPLFENVPDNKFQSGGSFQPK